MKTWDCIVRINVEGSHVIQIEAETKEAAAEIATEEAKDLDWDKFEQAWSSATVDEDEVTEVTSDVSG